MGVVYDEAVGGSRRGAFCESKGLSSIKYEIFNKWMLMSSYIDRVGSDTLALLDDCGAPITGPCSD